MHFETRRKDDSEARILPLVNVVFLLLIFFMLAGSFGVNDPFDVAAPDSISETAHETASVHVLLGADGRLALDGKVMDEAVLLEQVKTRLAAAPTLRVQLKADAQTAANRVVLLLEGLREAGVERLRLLTLPSIP